MATDLKALVRDFDWSRTPLGSSQTWSRALITAANLVVDCAFPMVLLWGTDLIQIYNDSYAEIMGDKHPLGLGQPTRDCWPEVWHVNQPIYQRVWLGEALTFENQLYPINRHGYLEHAYFTISYSPVRDETESVAGILVTVFETTESVKSEKARRLSEHHLQTAFGHAPLGVCLLRGPNFVYEIVNPTYQEFIPDRATVGRPIREVIPEMDDVASGILRRVYETAEPFEAHEFLFPLDRDRDGIAEDVWFTFSYQPMRERNGEVSGILIIALDVTSQVVGRQRLELLSKSLEEFAYVASHDLREPLRLVNLYAELLRKKLPPGLYDENKYVSFIENGAQRIGTLLTDLLAYSHTLHTSLDTENLKADLNEALSEAMAVLSERIAETRAVITFPLLPTVRAQTAQIVHVFQNLISNALKFCKPYGTPHVTIAVERKVDSWQISVRDNGIGFEHAQTERIFDMFARLHSQSDYAGSGMGLAICKRIVERFGGRMWAESELGVGSIFYFTLVES